MAQNDEKGRGQMNWTTQEVVIRNRAVVEARNGHVKNRLRSILDSWTANRKSCEQRPIST